MEKLFIVKIGGNVIDDQNLLADFIKTFAGIQHKKILVHGGGAMATRVAEAMGVPQQMKDGRRITDKETIKIVTMVYAGLINKQLVAGLQANQCQAIGFTGADGNMLRARKRASKPIDYGFVGDVESVNVTLLSLLLHQDFTPVFSPITHDGKGDLLNTNADTIGFELAKALCNLYEISLVYCFDKPGVLEDVQDPGSVINRITPGEFAGLKESNTIHSGMLPKIENALTAVATGVRHVVIGHAQQLTQLISRQAGTTVENE